MMDLWNLHQVRRPRESRLVGRLQLASSPPLVHLRGTWWSGHTGQRACCSPKQYRRLDFRRWAHGGQRKGPWGSIIRMMRSLSGSRCRRPVPAVSGEVRGYGSCRVPPQVAAAPSTVPSGQQDHSSQDDQLSHGMFHWASSAARRSARVRFQPLARSQAGYRRPASDNGVPGNELVHRKSGHYPQRRR